MKILKVVAFGVLVVGFVYWLLFSLIFVSPDLSVRKAQSLDGTRLVIQNRGNGPITIQKLVANNRNDCTISTDVGHALSFKLPTRLKVGDEGYWLTNCNVVRVTIETDKGTATYSWKE